MNRDEFLSVVDDLINEIASCSTRSWNMDPLKRFICEHYKLSEKELRICFNCGGDLKNPRQKTYCSPSCASEFTKKYYWQPLRDSVIEEVGCCQICGAPVEWPGDKYRKNPVWFYWEINKDIEVHHIVPVKANGGGGKVFDRNNLLVLCIKCHGLEHRRLNQEDRVRNFRENQNILDNFME